MTDKKNNALVFVAPLLVMIVNLLVFGLAGSGILPAITNVSAWTISIIGSVVLALVCSAVFSVPIAAVIYALGSVLVYFVFGSLGSVLVMESVPVGGIYALFGATLVLRGTTSFGVYFLNKIKVVLIVPVALVIAIDVFFSVVWLGASPVLLGLGMGAPLVLGFIIGAILKVLDTAKGSVQISASVEPISDEEPVATPAVSKQAPAVKATAKTVAKSVVAPVSEPNPEVVKKAELKSVEVEEAKGKVATAESSIKEVAPVKEESSVAEAKAVLKPNPDVAKAVEIKSNSAVAEESQVSEPVAVEKPKVAEPVVKPVVERAIPAGRDILSEHLELMNKLKRN
jgi:hypothetical protein